MAIRALALLNKQGRFTGSIMAILAIMLFSCREQDKEKISLLSRLHRVDVRENSNSVLHHLPPYLQLLGDSLVCMKLSATNFTVYNYFTGNIQQQLFIYTGALPRLLTEVRRKVNPKYTLMTEQESKEAATPRIRIQSIAYNDEKGNFLLFFDAFFYIDSPMVIKGKSEPFKWIKGIPFVTMLDAQLNHSNQYVLLDYGKTSPNFSYGGLVFRDKLILPNYDPQRAGASSLGMLCNIDLADPAYTMRNLALPFDARTLELQKMNRTEIVCFAAADSGLYYMAFGNKLLCSKDNRFQEVYRMDTSEYVYDLYFNQSRNLLFMNTFSWGWEDREQKGCRIFSLDPQTRVLETVYAWTEASAVTFVNDSMLLKLSKKATQKSYEFELYKY